MIRKLKLAFVSTAFLLVAGCGQNVPAKLEVKDVSSGKTYTTYADLTKEEKGIGYKLFDVTSSTSVTLTSYEVKTLEAEMTVDPKSAEALAYQTAKAKAGK